MSRIFISHSSANNALALAMGRWLSDNGWNDYFLDLEPAKGLAPGERWQEALKNAADHCEAVLFLISPAWRDSRWCLVEFQLAKLLGKTIFGVLVETVRLDTLPKDMTSEWQLCDLVSGVQRLGFRVSHDPVVSETDVSFGEAGLARLKLGLKRAGLDPSNFPWPPADDVRRPPYPGLRALGTEDAAVFFGREAAVVRGLDALRTVRERGIERMFVIVGASGAGKSSFLRAGLWPRLSRDDHNFLPLPVIRPERAVLHGAAGLVVSLERAFRELGSNRSRAEISRAVQTPDGLDLLLGEIQVRHSSRLGQDAPVPTIVISIDQGEELFTAEGQAEGLQLLSSLGQMLVPSQGEDIDAIDKRKRALAVVAIRTDAFEQLQTEPTLRCIASQVFSLPPMERVEFKAVIEGPAARASGAGHNLTVQPALTERLLQDAKGPDALPLLAFTLERLYTDYGSTGYLRLEDYEALGGVRGSIDAAVGSAFADPERKPAIPADKAERERLLREGLIPWLARVDPQTEEPKRRVARWDELPEVAHAVLERLIEQRLLLRDRRKIEWSGDEVTVVEIAHEALLRQWPTLTTWLDADTSALKILDAVQRAADEWQRNTCGRAWLVHAGERLASGETLRERPDFERLLGVNGRAYLRACRDREEDVRAEREAQIKQIVTEQARVKEEQARTGRAQKRSLVLLILIAGVLIAASGWIIGQTRAVARQTSLVLASAAGTANDAGRYDQAMRLAMLGTRKNWLSPGSAEAERELVRGAYASMLVAQLNGHQGATISASFSPDGRRVVTASEDNTVRVWDAATGVEIARLKGHENHVRSANFSPDGRRVVTASSDNTARLWEAEQGKELAQLKGHQAVVNSATFSPDGQRVVTASGDMTARVWDAAAGTAIAHLKGHQNSLNSAAFSPDGQRVVTASEDKTARVWDAATGKEIALLTGHRGAVNSATFSPDGRWVVTASEDKTARVWDAATGREIALLTGHQGAVKSASFSPEGRRVLTGSHDGTARVWDAVSGKEILQLKGHQAAVSSAAFSRDGQRAVTSSWDKSASIWDAATGNEIAQLNGHQGAVNSATFSPDGQRVVTASEDKTARVWDVSPATQIAQFNRRQVRDWRLTRSPAAFSPDGQRVVTASRDQSARVWDATSGRELAKLEGVWPAAFSPDSQQVVTASSDNTARVWDVATGKEIAQLNGHQGEVRFVAFSPDGRRVLTASEDNTVCVWDATTGNRIAKLNGPQGQVGSVAAFSPDGQRIVTASKDKIARLWDATTGVEVAQFDGHKGEGAVNSVAFSPDGRRLVTALGNNTARVWEAATGKEIALLTGHRGVVKSAVFSRDGQRVVTASEDKTARVWDAATGREIAQLNGHQGGVWSADFSPDGQRVVTRSWDRSARVWDAATGKEVAYVEGVWFAAFSRDGQRLVTAYDDKSTLVWDLRWLMKYRGRNMATTVCTDKLIGANLLTGDDELVTPIIHGRSGENVCGS